MLLRTDNNMKTYSVAILVFLQVLPMLATAATMHSLDDPKETVIIGGKNYFFSSVAVNAPDAITLCRTELGMTLAGLETEAEFEAVTDYISANIGATVYVWTSGSRHTDYWIWDNTGEAFAFFKWGPGEPQVTDTRTQQTLCVYNGLMYDCNPNNLQKFVCEEKPRCLSSL